jgi:ankyrin repeat protein
MFMLCQDSRPDPLVGTRRQNEINGETALMRASYVGFLDTVKVLLAHGADVNIQDFSGETALTMAGYGDHAGIVELLKKAGSPEE